MVQQMQPMDLCTILPSLRTRSPWFLNDQRVDVVSNMSLTMTATHMPDDW
jgi:hypothetical protein